MGGRGAGRPAKDPAGARSAHAHGSAVRAGAKGCVHNHVHEQISYCVAGRFEYFLDGQTHVLAKGESIYVPSNARHRATTLEAGTLIDVFTPVREDLLGRRVDDAG